ncbi:PR domain zinc finger protein 2-like [Nasonia vitripennis]|uniref:CCHC-type domain-containing protein n=1 Tax=Nasonia vitripennis TaxID=7425 RepID=A0A7M7Q0G6_NASVI|nr:PR domain zinc finger protein 2-like [Nasonia vitripennis]
MLQIRKSVMPRRTRSRSLLTESRHVAEEEFVPPTFTAVPPDFVPPQWSTRHERIRDPNGPKSEETMHRELRVRDAIRRREMEEEEERERELLAGSDDEARTVEPMEVAAFTLIPAETNTKVGGGRNPSSKVSPWFRLESAEERESREAVEELRRVVEKETGVDLPTQVEERTLDTRGLPQRPFTTRDAREGTTTPKKDPVCSTPEDTVRERKRGLQLKVKLSGLRYSGLKPIPTDPELDPPPYSCFNCWGRGHTVFNCPEPRHGKICLNCGRFGEDLNSCPRCRDRHAEYLATVGSHKGVTTRTSSPKPGTSRDEAPRPTTPLSPEGATATSRTASISRHRRERSITWATPLAKESPKPSPPRSPKSCSAGRPRIRRGDPYATTEPTTTSSSSTSSRSGSPPREESPTRGVAEAVAETLRLIDEVRDLPQDIRDSILRRTFCQPKPRRSRSGSRKD